MAVEPPIIDPGLTKLQKILLRIKNATGFDWTFELAPDAAAQLEMSAEKLEDTLCDNHLDKVASLYAIVSCIISH